jgi:endogenous inhibitor of DNA gyrase (YacG/DUF329 family)
VTTQSRIAKCPTCGKPIEWTPAAKWRPFCSERCKLIDLGRWLDGSYTVPGEPADEEDLAEADPESAGDDRRRH